MVTIERKTYTVFTEVIKREIEVWGNNLNDGMNKTIIHKEHNLDY